MASSESPFQITLRAEAADIDENGHVNNTVYLRWVQDVATAHWQALSSPEDQKVVAWVVRRHEIDYKAPALLGDEIIVQTWIGVASGLTFERNTRILRGTDQQLLVEARTLWNPINPQTGRLQRIRAELRAQFSSNTTK